MKSLYFNTNIIIIITIISISIGISTSICVCDITDLVQIEYTVLLKELQIFVFGTWNVDKTPYKMTYTVQASV